MAKGLKFLKALLVGLAFCAAILCHAESLEELEGILSRFKTLDEFLGNDQAVRQFGEAYKAYLQDDASFDPVYKKFIELLKQASAKVPGFSEKAFRLNPRWREDAFSIRGEYSGKGLVVKAASGGLSEAIGKLASEVKQASEKFEADPNPNQLTDLISSLQKRYAKLSESDFAKLTGAERAEYNRRMGQLAEDPEALAITYYLTNRIILKNEDLRDWLYSGDADLTYEALKRLQQPSQFAKWLQNQGIDIPADLLARLRFNPEPLQAIVRSYEKGLQSMERFRALKEQRIDPALLARMLELRASGLSESQVLSRLSDSERTQLQEHRENLKKVQKLKNEESQQYDKASPFFYYETHFDATRGTLRLKNDMGVEMFFIPVPRPILAMLGGRKTKECVGGACAEDLVLKRIARFALDGDQSHFTELGDKKMEGMMGVMTVDHSRRGSAPVPYSVVDIMSRAIKGDILVKGASGRFVKYSFLDRFVDEFQSRLKSKGLVISNGSNISQNSGAAEVVENSPAYLEGGSIGKPSEFAPRDPMAQAIASQFPRSIYGYGNGGLIYDGMRGDGTEVRLLVPTSQRRKRSKEELEIEIVKKVLQGRPVTDRDPIWKAARENEVELQPLGHYTAHAQDLTSDLRNKAWALLTTGPPSAQKLEFISRKELPNPGDTVPQRIVDMIQAGLKKGNGETKQVAADLLLKLYERNPKDKRLLADAMLDGLNVALRSRGEPRTFSTSDAAIGAANFLARALTDHPLDKRLVSRELMKGLGGALGRSSGASDSAQLALPAGLAMKNHGESRAVGPVLRDTFHQIMAKLNSDEVRMSAFQSITEGILKNPGVKAWVEPKELSALFKQLFHGRGSAYGDESFYQKVANRLGQVLQNDSEAGVRLFRELFTVDHRRAAEILAQAFQGVWLSRPQDPALSAFIAESLSRPETAKFASMVLSKSIDARPTEKAFISTELVQAIREGFLKTTKARYLYYPLRSALIAHPKKTELLAIVPELLNAPADPVYYRESTASQAASAVEKALRSHPQELSLVSPAILEGMVRATRYYEYAYGLDAIASHHPAALVLSDSAEVRAYVEKKYGMVSLLVRGLLNPENKRDLIRVARAIAAGDERVTPLREELKASLASLDADPSRADCSHFFEQVRVKYLKAPASF